MIGIEEGITCLISAIQFQIVWIYSVVTVTMVTSMAKWSLTGMHDNSYQSCVTHTRQRMFGNWLIFPNLDCSHTTCYSQNHLPPSKIIQGKRSHVLIIWELQTVHAPPYCTVLMHRCSMAYKCSLGGGKHMHFSLSWDWLSWHLWEMLPVILYIF